MDKIEKNIRYSLLKHYVSTVIILIGLIACSSPNDQHSSSLVSQRSLDIQYDIDSTGGNVIAVSSQLEIGTGGLAFDSKGDLIIADFGAHLGNMGDKGDRVLSMDSSNKISLFAKGFNGASGNSFNSEGNLFQSNIGGNTITEISTDGTSETFVKRGLSSPVGIYITEDDELFVCNCGDNTIRKITKKGRSTLFAKSELLNCPNGITMDSAGTLYVSNFYDGGVIKIDSSGNSSLLAVIPGNNNGHLLFYDNFLYVVARSAHQIFKVSVRGDVSLFAGTGQKGSQDTTALQASFCYPNDIAISNDHSALYINEVADLSTDGNKLFPTTIRRIELF